MKQIYHYLRCLRLVITVALAMERRLRKNLWKRGWWKSNALHLQDRMYEEMSEFIAIRRSGDWREALNELADVANIGGMIVEVTRDYAKEIEQGEQS